jgi:hypothetical protein
MRAPLISVLVLLSSAVGACKKDYGVGEPCIPEPIPCDDDGENCGFGLADTFLQTNAPTCEANACIVHRLDNGTRGEIPADPRKVCEQESNAGCVSQAELERAVHCTCHCSGPKSAADYCECPADFVCKEVLSDGEVAFRGSYCVRP